MPCKSSEMRRDRDSPKYQHTIQVTKLAESQNRYAKM